MNQDREFMPFIYKKQIFMACYTAISSVSITIHKFHVKSYFYNK